MPTSSKVAALVLAAFGAFSIWVAAGYGFTGFLSLAAREPWALQMLLDLAIACSFAIGWMLHDAKKRGIKPWPYVVLTIFTGSVGVLVYVVRRGLRAR
ncbi:MAG TPA: DUF2834 domain-containing protein [Kofleriaceae bacterium]